MQQRRKILLCLNEQYDLVLTCQHCIQNDEEYFLKALLLGGSGSGKPGTPFNKYLVNVK